MGVEEAGAEADNDEDADEYEDDDKDEATPPVVLLVVDSNRADAAIVDGNPDACPGIWEPAGLFSE